MEILTVSIPLESLFYGFIFSSSGKILAYPKSTLCGMSFPLLLGQPADPPSTLIIGSMFPEGIMNLIDQLKCELCEPLLLGPLCQADEIDHREGVCPKMGTCGNFNFT
jgi:hypothetical protein